MKCQECETEEAGRRANENGEYCCRTCNSCNSFKGSRLMVPGGGIVLR